MFSCDIFPDFYSYSEPVARKQHVCCECGAPILKGEKHFHGTGKWEGQIDSHRQHLLCMEACMVIRDEFNDYECIPFGGLSECFADLNEWYRGQRQRFRGEDKWVRLRRLMARIRHRERTHAAAVAARGE